MEVKDGAKQFVGSSGGNAGNKMEFIGFQSIIYFSFNTIRGRVDFRQVEPRGDGGEVEEKLLFFKFINNKIVIQSSSTFSETAGTIGEKPLTCCPYSIVERQELHFFGC